MMDVTAAQDVTLASEPATREHVSLHSRTRCAGTPWTPWHRVQSCKDEAAARARIAELEGQDVTLGGLLSPRNWATQYQIRAEVQTTLATVDPSWQRVAAVKPRRKRFPRQSPPLTIHRA